MRAFAVLSASLFFTANIAAQAAHPPRLAEPVTVDGHRLAVPTPDQLAWQQLELGMFIHMAPQTWQDTEVDNGSTPASAINPEKLDTDQWVAVAKSMGARYIVFVAKHEGGFCWWPTATTDYSVKSSPWRGGRGDVLADLSASCKKAGIKLGVYLSPQDKKHGIGVGGKANDPTKQAEYEKLFRQQLTEVLSNYGEMVEVWFDGSLIFDVGDILEKYAPHAMIFQGPQATIRWVGNEDGVCPESAWNSVKSGTKKWGDYTAADSDVNGDRWLPIECDARIRSTWFWKTNNQDTLKTLDQLLDMYEKSVGRGANLLLNQTPDRSGLIPDADAKRADEFGAAIFRRYPIASVIYESSTTTTDAGQVIAFGPDQTVKQVVLSEELNWGHRVRKYELVALLPDGEEKVLAKGTSMGGRQIHRFPPVVASEIRLRILESVPPWSVKMSPSPAGPRKLFPPGGN